MAPGAGEGSAARRHLIGIGETASGLVATFARAGVDTPAVIERIPLSGPFSWEVTGPRVCVGKWEPDPSQAYGAYRHVPCPTQTEVGADFVCQPCSGLESPECVFEPQCAVDASGCHCAAFRGVTHVVYAAFYGTLPKVGMTQAWRVRARLREQGADGWFVIQGHPFGEPTGTLDRAAARAVERQIGFLYGLPEWRSYRETLPQLVREVPWDRVEEKVALLRERLALRYEPEPAFHRIEDHPIRQPLPSVPVRLHPEGKHEGTWLGSKGNHLLFIRDPDARRLVVGEPAVGALKRSDLLGRFVQITE